MTEHEKPPGYLVINEGKHYKLSEAESVAFQRSMNANARHNDSAAEINEWHVSAEKRMEFLACSAMNGLLFRGDATLADIPKKAMKLAQEMFDELEKWEVKEAPRPASVATTGGAIGGCPFARANRRGGSRSNLGLRKCSRQGNRDMVRPWYGRQRRCRYDCLQGARPSVNWSRGVQ